MPVTTSMHPISQRVPLAYVQLFYSPHRCLQRFHLYWRIGCRSCYQWWSLLVRLKSRPQSVDYPRRRMRDAVSTKYYQKRHADASAKRWLTRSESWEACCYAVMLTTILVRVCTPIRKRGISSAQYLDCRAHRWQGLP